MCIFQTGVSSNTGFTVVLDLMQYLKLSNVSVVKQSNEKIMQYLFILFSTLSERLSFLPV